MKMDDIRNATFLNFVNAANAVDEFCQQYYYSVYIDSKEKVAS